LISDLLVFSRTARQPVHKQVVRMAELVREVLAGLEASRNGRTIEVRVGDLPDAAADPTLVKQVLTNLLANAFKFTRTRVVACVEVGYGSRDDEPAYFVKDNGVGFDMAQADRLFGVFQRLHREDEYEGTGVGLAIVERIVRRHGGRVWAQAAPDEGATFWFTLPPVEDVPPVPH
jgi:light-regulated signal transduction histidine kinase (bacteriophytochrome)